MIIKKSDVASSVKFYALDCQTYISDLFKDKPPFGSMKCVVAPGITSDVHSHHENECFYIVKGSGFVNIGDVRYPVSEGDIAAIPPFVDHTIHNPNRDSLEFLTFWWENLASLSNVIANQNNNSDETQLIFSTPPTPNGSLHLGHLSGPYTGADIYKRYLTMNGVSCFHATGRDDNQSYVVRKALDMGKNPEEIANEYSAQIKSTFDGIGVNLDHYSEPNASPYHTLLTQKIFKDLYDKNLIYPKESDALFCRKTGQYLYEAHVSGCCPHCCAGSDGNACEQCGRPNDIVDLVSPKSKYADEGVEVRRITRLYFKMGALAEGVRHFHRTVSMPPHLRQLCGDMMSDGLPDICVSHISDWGIDVPIEGYENQKIYVWFEMAAGYLAAAQEIAEKYSLSKIENNGWKYFYNNTQASVSHFFGFDNGYFHAILFPAIYIGLGLDIHLPKAFVVNELLNLDGLKFSTSRGHLIRGSDMLEYVCSDYLRYYLSHIRPETQKTDFRLSDFTDTINKQLVGMWQSYINDVFERNQTIFDGRVPEAGAWEAEHKDFFAYLSQTILQAEKYYSLEYFSPQKIVALSNDLIKECQRFSQSQLFYRNSNAFFNHMRTGMALEFSGLRVLSLLMAPIMPDFSEKLWGILEGKQEMKWSHHPCFLSTEKIDADYIFFEQVTESVYALQKK